MISIERVRNGYVLTVNEDGEEYTMVCQKEFSSMNAALASVCNILKEHWFEADEGIHLIVEAKP
jgi:hypothetical protein